LNRKVAKVAKIFLFFPVRNERTGKTIGLVGQLQFTDIDLWTPTIAVPTACKHLYGIDRYDPVKIVFLGALGVLSEAGGKYAFTLENT